MNWDSLDHLSTIMSLITAPAGIVALVAYIKDWGRARQLQHVIVTVFATLALVAYAFDVSDRLGLFASDDRIPGLIAGAAISPPATFEASVNGDLILRYKNNHRLMLIVRAWYPDLDSMNDKCMEKSVLYSITGGIELLATTGLDRLRLKNKERTVIDMTSL